MCTLNVNLIIYRKNANRNGLPRHLFPYDVVFSKVLCRGELCSPAKTSLRCGGGRTQFAPTGISKEGFCLKEQYLDNIVFSVDGVAFTTLNIVFEQFSRFIPEHSHSDSSYEIHYIPYGCGKAVVDGTEYEIVPETLYITGPGVKHEQIPSKANPMAEYCVYLKMQSRPAPSQLISLFEYKKFWFGTDAENIRAIMTELFDELKNRRKGYSALAEALLKQLVVKAIRNYASGQELSASADLNESQLLVAEECFLYDYRDLTLERLALRLGLGARQTERFLRKHYGKTFVQKRTESRVAAAAVMLTQSAKSVASIAEELGYSSPEHFSAAFKRVQGVSPRAFRAKGGQNRYGTISKDYPPGR